MSNYSKGDIVLVEVEYTDHSGRRIRPAVVLSIARYNRSAPDVVILPISSNLDPIPHLGYHTIADWQGAGLLFPSIAKATPQTVEASLIRRRIGVLRPADLAAVEQALRQVLDLP